MYDPDIMAWWPTEESSGVYGSKVRVMDPDFDKLRAALDKVQAQIDAVRDKIDMSTFAPVVSVAYDTNHCVLVIQLAWTARGKGEQRQRLPRWIPVEERLPEEGEAVAIIILCDGEEYYRVGWHKEQGDWRQMGIGCVCGKVTHWCPLPTREEVVDNDESNPDH